MEVPCKRKGKRRGTRALKQQEKESREGEAKSEKEGKGRKEENTKRRQTLTDGGSETEKDRKA